MDIEITLSNYRCFSDERPAKFIIGPGITGFVGVNNAGKSALLRFFYEHRNTLRLFQHGLNHQAPHLHLPDMPTGVARHETFCDRNERPAKIEFKVKPAHDDTADNRTVDRIELCLPQASTTAEYTIYSCGEKVIWKTVGGRWGYYSGKRFDIACSSLELFRAIALLSESLYIPSIRVAQGHAGWQSYGCDSGAALVQKWADLDTGDHTPHYRVTEQVNKWIGQLMGAPSATLQANNNKNGFLISLERGKEALVRCGTGIQHLVYTLVHAAISRPAYIIIDEPESGLHPTLQVGLLELLSRLAKHGVVLATHNYGLAMTVCKRLYCVSIGPEGSEVREHGSNPDLAEFLGDFGFAKYQQLGCEHILLVEGPSDHIVFEHFLRELGCVAKVAILQLGGSSLINPRTTEHLAQLARLGCKVAVVIDSERQSEAAPLAPDRAEFCINCSKLGYDVHVLERRAIENYFTADALRAVYGDNVRALEPYEPRTSANWPGSKGDNGRIAAKMRMDEDVYKRQVRGAPAQGFGG